MTVNENEDENSEQHSDPPTLADLTAAPCSVRLIVGIGASIGGLDAFKHFFSAMPINTGMSFVLVQHLDPTASSHLLQIVAGYTQMEVHLACEGSRVLPNMVYVIPPDTVLTIRGGVLHTAHPAVKAARRVSVSTFLSSLARDQGELAVGIILSGFGGDGVEGIAAIKDHGGLTLSQADFDHHAKAGMPLSATAAGFVDHVLPVEDMPQALIKYQAHLGVSQAAVGKDGIRGDLAPFLPKICAVVKARIGRDFSLYKPGTLMRRIQRRMNMLQAKDVPIYLEQLTNLPHEVEALFQEFLVSVTQFFRDPAAFEALELSVITKIVETQDETEPVRVWVAACATGEEAYSIAILLLEYMARTGCHRPIQIFATDVDTRAIDFARAGRYPASITTAVSKERLAGYFVRNGDHYHVTKALRDVCVFSTHDVVKDPPFSRLDLVSCRNLLIYLQTPLQEQVFMLFHYALRPRGFLFLGQSESVPMQSRHFMALDKQHRLFIRGEAAARFPSFLLSSTRHRSVLPHGRKNQKAIDSLENQAAQLLSRFTPAFVIVDRQNDIVHFSGQTGRFLEPMIGVASLNLFKLLQADLQVATRQALTKARSTGKRVVIEGAGLLALDGGAGTTLIVEKLPGTDAAELLVVAFQRGTSSVPLLARPGDRADILNDENGTDDGSALQAMERLLRATRERLDASTEELETVTEELQSSIQEYLAVNEELQAANEELETSKEELQSVNEELQTTNVELNHRNDSLIRTNSDLANLFDSTPIATLFLNNDLTIRRFTPRLQDIFRIRDGDEGRPISDLASHLTHSVMTVDVQTVLRDLKHVEREVAADNGATYLMQVRPYRDLNNTISGAVVSFVDISERKLHEQARARLAAIVDSSQDGIISMDLDGVITSWNAGAETLFGHTAQAAIGSRLATLIRNPAAQSWFGTSSTFDLSRPAERFDSHATTLSDREIEISVTISPLRDGDGQIIGASVVARDISERNAADRKAGLLLGELDHRVKNILAIVAAVVSQTLSSGLSPEDFAVEVEGRISAVAKAHSLLTQGSHGMISLRDIVSTELAPYNRDAGHVVIDCVDLALTPKAGMSLAMAVHELTSNAAKYGALSTASGHLSVVARSVPGVDVPLLVLDWIEANGPAVEPPTRRGFGTSLIEGALTYELDARVSRRFEPTGLVCSFEIPLTEEVGYVQHPFGV